MAKRVLDSLPRGPGAGRMPPTPRAKVTRTPHPRFRITRGIKKWIRDAILAWPEKTITWEGVCETVRKKYPQAVWKRQTLAKNDELQKAFQDTKRRLLREREETAAKVQTGGGKTAKRSRLKSGSDEFYQERIASLETRVGELEAENARLKRQFARWQRNAFIAGMTTQQLDRPLLPIDRGQADE
jgi:predicted RNase H-like nuclease (RuvC/YqgF family)